MDDAKKDWNQGIAGLIADLQPFMQMVEAVKGSSNTTCADAYKKWHNEVGDQHDDYAWEQAWKAREPEILALHRQLAAERLRADQGWQRAEAKSKECLELREKLAKLV